MTDLQSDINATIAAAVNSQVTARVAEAFAGDEFLKSLVTAAVTQPIAVRDPHTYSDRKTTFIDETLRKVVQDVTRSALTKVVEEEREAIEAEVRKALKAQVGAMAKGFADNMVENAKSGYGVRVNFDWRG